MPRECLPLSSSRSTAARPSPAQTGSSASPGGSPASARPATTWWSSCPRWAIRPMNCSASRPPSPTSPMLASSTCSSRPASTRPRRSLSMALHGLGVAAISLTGAQAGITTDGRYGRARIADIEPRRVRAEIDAGKVVIVAGFQGQSAAAVGQNEMTTLGRGGSDTTAVALAVALRARALPDLHRRARHLHRRPAPRAHRPAARRSSATRRCSSWPTRAPRSCRSGPSSWAG